MVVAILAVLEAGGAYLPLDPDYPVDRLAFMVRDARVRVLLSLDPPPAALAEAAEISLCLGEPPDDSAGCEPRSAVPGDLAWVIYTSGSTGKPKGVMVTHRNAVNFFAGMDRLGLETPSGSGTWLAATSMSFDISVLELLWTLGLGFRVVLAGVAEQQDQAPTQPSEAAKARRETDFSLFYFASEDAGGRRPGRYRLLLEGARFADRNGFSAVWTPERHFHAFGGLYPNPSVTGAAVAAVTERVAIRAGSVVLPLHHPVRVAEDWAVIDNLSGGRAAISFATGWHADDFVLAPHNYDERKAVMLRDIETVRALWRGETVTLTGGAGQDVGVRIFPQPLQPELPIWLTAAGNPETFRLAGELGAGLLTHLLGQSVDELAEKLALYRRAWQDHGHPGEGHVTLMLHTFVGEDMERVREAVREPFTQYLKSATFLLANLARTMDWDFDPAKMSDEDMEALLSHAFNRYFETSGLMGTPESCVRTIERLRSVGVDEVGCLIDFGIDEDLTLAALEPLDEVRRQSRGLGSVHSAGTTLGSGTARGARGRLPASLGQLLLRHGVTHFQCTPSQAALLVADPGAAAGLAALDTWLLGGEALPQALTEKLSGLTSAELHNMYGPTETTIWSASERLGRAARTTLGRPIANTATCVVDRHGRPVPVNVAGELVIGGVGVARGYLNRPALTASRFVPDMHSCDPGRRRYHTGDLARVLPDGRLDFLGRLDHQVKLLGHRIELGEIESLLERHPGVVESAVVVRQARPGAGENDPRLYAWVVGARRTAPRLRLSEAQRDTLLEGRERFTLPNGMVVTHHDARQALLVYDEVFDQAMYRRHGVSFEDGDVIFDVGANTGFFTMFACQQCEPSKVYAFEPIPANYEVMRLNTALYGVRVRTFACGLASRPGTAEFTFYPNAAGLSSRFADPDVDRHTVAAALGALGESQGLEPLSGDEVEAALDEYLASEKCTCSLRALSDVIREEGIERIDLLKVDVEGSEIEVLEGIADEDWPKIGQLVLEVHGDPHLARCREILGGHGFDVTVEDFLVLDGNGGPTGENTGVPRFYMLYARHPAWSAGRTRPEISASLPAEALSVEELREGLSRHLPAYMVPSAVFVVDELPRTPNGKVDRSALANRELPSSGAAGRAVKTAYVAPRSELERRVAGVWQEVLGVAAIGLDDNFFEAGGTSLSLMQASLRLEAELERPVPLVELFRHPTVASLSTHLSQGEGKDTVGQGAARGQKQSEAMKSENILERQRRSAAVRRGRRRGGRRPTARR